MEIFSSGSLSHAEKAQAFEAFARFTRNVPDDEFITFQKHMFGGVELLVLASWKTTECGFDAEDTGRCTLYLNDGISKVPRTIYK